VSSSCVIEPRVSTQKGKAVILATNETTVRGRRSCQSKKLNRYTELKPKTAAYFMPNKNQMPPGKSTAMMTADRAVVTFRIMRARTIAAITQRSNVKGFEKFKRNSRVARIQASS
jgi:hypothetical protein